MAPRAKHARTTSEASDRSYYQAPRALTHKVTNPTPPPPTLEIILILGDDPTNQKATIHSRLASDFSAHAIHTRALLQTLLESIIDIDHEKGGKIRLKPGRNIAPEALGNLHPLSLIKIARTKEKRVPAFFLVGMLRFEIDRLVKAGRRRFVLSGFGEDMESVRGFVAEIAKPSAILSIRKPDTQRCEDRAHIESKFRDRVVSVDEGNGEKETYERLLKAMGERVVQSPAEPGHGEVGL